MALHHAADNLAAGQVTQVTHIVVREQASHILGLFDVIEAGNVLDCGGQRGHGGAPFGGAVEMVEIMLQGVHSFQGGVNNSRCQRVVGNGACGILQRGVEQPGLLLQGDEVSNTEFACKQIIHEHGVFGFVVGFSCGGFERCGQGLTGISCCSHGFSFSCDSI